MRNIIMWFINLFKKSEPEKTQVQPEFKPEFQPEIKDIIVVPDEPEIKNDAEIKTPGKFKMFKLEINRFKEIYDGTLGIFTLYKCFENEERPVFKGYSLEPAGPDTTDSGKDRRIPEGKYNVKWLPSPRFKRTLATLYNEKVPESRRILIHVGNYPKNTEGCILLGRTFNTQGVFESTSAVNEFHDWCLNKDLIVTIKNNFEEL